MEFPGFVTFVEGATVVVTLLMTASGFPGCMKMYRNKSTENAPFLLFLVYCLVSCICLQYGMMVQNRTLIFLNVVAVLAWGAYACVYVIVSKSKTLPLVKAASIGILYWGHLYYLQTLPSKSVIPTIGKYMIFWCTTAYIIPAGEILTIVREKSTRSCDMSLLLGGTLSASVWYLYGFLVNDFNIYFPSIPALCVCSCKFILMFMYRNTGKETFLKKESSHFSTDFHDDVYKVKSRQGLRQRN